MSLKKAIQFFKNRIKNIKSENDLILIIDSGESEAIILYRELKANFLIIDDKHARKIAESLKVKCIGTLGILMVAKEKELLKKLNPLFRELIKYKRYYGIDLLNSILKKNNEELIA